METAAILYNRRSEYPLRFRPKGLPQHSGQHEREGDVGAAANASIMIDAQSNLYHFLQHTTPRVLCQSLPKSQIHILASRGSSSHNQCFFSLNDLWDSFDEWSAYGAGVPILYSKESVMQYYVPYLSGIQLYASLESELTRKSRRRLGDDSDGSEIDYRDSNSESSSSDVEIDGPSNHSQWTASDILERNHPGETLLFEYFESAAPSHRAPLFDKVRRLATEFPGLKTLCSNEISESSWFSVAWYPIYRIPVGSTLKDLTACFLTYHSLSTLHTGRPTEVAGSQSVSGGQMLLHPFGFAGYKFRGPVWSLVGARDQHNTSLLLKSSGDWLQRLHARHPDFDYFMANNSKW